MSADRVSSSESLDTEGHRLMSHFNKYYAALIAEQHSPSATANSPLLCALAMNLNAHPFPFFSHYD